MGNVVRKKTCLIVCFILVMTTLCGCGAIDRITDGVNRKKEIETMAQQVMQCIVDKDKTELLTFFSAYALNNHAEKVYPQINSAFDFINGKIISYDYNSVYDESEKVYYGKVKYYNCYPEFRNVITDTGFKYRITFSFCHTWEEKPEREGISMIRIMDAEDSKNRVEIGFIYDDYE